MLADLCEEFGRFFPVNFNRNLTRKMHSLAITVPYFLRNHGKYFYKVGKVEQVGERLHRQFNDLERNFINIIDKPLKSFLKIRKFEVDQSNHSICYPKSYSQK